MSLFAELFTLTKERRFAMLVSSDHDTGLLTISVMPRALNEADGQYCKDLTLTAKPEEFDTGFVVAIGEYRSKLIPLLEQAKEATAAIEKASQSTKSSAAPKASTKTSNTRRDPKSGQSSAATTPSEDKAKAYRDASSGDGDDETEPSNDWMKNRQPELF